jgi:hypothetical protein
MVLVAKGFIAIVAGAIAGALLALALSGCSPGLNAVGTGAGMAAGYEPYQGFQPLPVLSSPHMQSCVMQQDPIGGISGPTLRMRCY